MDRNLENLYIKLLSATAGEVPSFEKRVPPDKFADAENFDSPDMKADRILRDYLDFDDEILITEEDAKLSNLRRAEKSVAISQKLIVNAQATLKEIEEKILELQREQAKLLEVALQNNGLNDETKKQGQELQTQKHRYEFLKTILTAYEPVLIEDSERMETKFQESFRKVFGQRLRQARTANKLNMDELAEKVGLKRLAINNYELGLRDPSAFSVYRICKALNITPNYLLDLPDYNENKE